MSYNKELKKANARIAEAQKYFYAYISEKRAHEKQENEEKEYRARRAAEYREADARRKASQQKPEPQKQAVVYVDASEKYERFEVKKLSKGHFEVTADGKVINKKFKSITAANEWCAIHSK